MSRFTGPPSARTLLASLTVAALALTSAACGGDGGKSDGTPASSSALPVNKATGQPIVIGLINNDTNPLGSFADISKAARAAVSYVNENLGGVSGRPFELATCTPNGSAPASANCAAEILGQKPALVVGGLDLGAGGSVPALAKAGVPYLPSAAIGAIEFTSPNAFSFLSGSPGSLSAASAYVAEKLKPKRVAVMFNDSPEARLAAQGYIESVLKAKGVTDVVLTPYGTNETDLTGPVSQALKGGTDTVIGLMPASGCANVLKAKQSLGSQATFLFSGACADPQVFKAAGAGAENTYFSAQQLLPGTDDPEVKAFETAMAQYAEGVPLSGFTQGVFGTIVTLSKVLGTVSQPDSPEEVTAALKKTADQPTFMGPSITCDGKQLTGLSGFCTRAARIAQYKAGALTDAGGQWFTS